MGHQLAFAVASDTTRTVPDHVAALKEAVLWPSVQPAGKAAIKE
jgi:hypothetical protein